MKPDIHDLRAEYSTGRASSDELAFVDMEARLHRAAILLRGGGDYLGACSNWPEMKPEVGDYNHGEITLPAELVKVIEKWGRDFPRPEPGEIDRALEDMLLINPADKLERRVLALRAFQLHFGRRSWRSIGRAVHVSHEYARRTHRDVIERALRNQAALRNADKHERLIARNMGVRA